MREVAVGMGILVGFLLLAGCGDDDTLSVVRGDAGGISGNISDYEIFVEGGIVYMTDKKTMKLYVFAGEEYRREDFGNSIALCKIQEGVILVAIGAPNSSNGKGAVYTYLITESGVESKIKATPRSGVMGYGSQIKFSKEATGWVLIIESTVGGSMRIEAHRLM